MRLSEPSLTADGWDSTWKWPLVAVVVIISVIIALLVFVMNVSLKQQGWLLYEMARTNKELALTTRDLEDEKVCLNRQAIRPHLSDAPDQPSDRISLAHATLYFTLLTLHQTASPWHM